MKNSEKQKLKECFNKAAAYYDQQSILQQRIGQSLLEQLVAVVPAVTGIHAGTTATVQRIIDLGCGTGIITEKLAQTFQYRQFYAVDIAEQLLLQAKTRLSPLGIEVFNADFEEYIAGTPLFNLAFANMALQWSFNFAHTLQKISSLLETKGLLAFSLPLAGTFTELSQNYPINKFYAAQEILDFLSQVQLTPLTFTTETIHLQFASLQAALWSIKAMGANYVKKESRRTKPKAMNATQLLQPTGLTYEIGYFIAQKVPSPSQSFDLIPFSHKGRRNNEVEGL